MGDGGLQSNIILLVSDQHRGDWMGCAGHPAFRGFTPRMDDLARRGVRFADCSCNSPLCVPSRMSLLTGRQPWRNGLTINEHELAGDTPTIAHALGLAGYESVLCGRMHFTGADQRHGYHRRLVGDICSTAQGGRRTEYGELKGSDSGVDAAVAHAGAGDSPVLRYDEQVTVAAERFLRERHDDGPLFLTVGWYGPHHPYRADEGRVSEAARRLRDAGDAAIPHDADDHPFSRGRRARAKPQVLDSATVATVRSSYAAMINIIDGHIGRVLDAARARGASRPTIVVYVSDHGEGAGDHGLYGKVYLYRQAMQVPLIVGPLDDASAEVLGGAVAPGVVESPTSLVDLASTLCALAGAETLPDGDGRDLGELLRTPGRGADPDWRERPVLADLCLGWTGVPACRQVRRGRWVYNRIHGMPDQLFDWHTDPQELRDRAGDPACADILADLRALSSADGWDPEAIQRRDEERTRGWQMVRRWGQRFVTGIDELWDAHAPVFEFRREAIPVRANAQPPQREG